MPPCHHANVPPCHRSFIKLSDNHPTYILICCHTHGWQVTTWNMPRMPCRLQRLLTYLYLAIITLSSGLSLFALTYMTRHFTPHESTLSSNCKLTSTHTTTVYTWRYCTSSETLPLCRDPLLLLPALCDCH